MEVTEAMIEAGAKAIYDAEDTQSGDHVGTVIWNSDHLFYDTVEGEDIVDTARRASMPVCRDAALAAYTAMRALEPRASSDGVVERCLYRFRTLLSSNPNAEGSEFVDAFDDLSRRILAALRPVEADDAGLIERLRARAGLAEGPICVRAADRIAALERALDGALDLFDECEIAYPLEWHLAAGRAILTDKGERTKP